MTNLHDWWRTREIAERLQSGFWQCAIVLFMKVRTPDGLIDENFTGFAVSISGRLLWITAGHVVDAMKLYLEDARFEVIEMKWIDRHDVLRAKGIVVSRDRIIYGSGTEVGKDFGIVGMPVFEGENLKNNSRFKPLQKFAWEKPLPTEPDGYHVIGFPYMLHRVAPPVIEDKMRKIVHTVEIVSLPVMRLAYDDLHPQVRELWPDDGSFYGQRMHYIPSAPQPHDIRGMSGGPIISLALDANGDIAWQLIAIQSKGIPDRGLIRGEPFESVTNLLKDALG